jgi:E3 Ubiquitin ligase
MMHASDAHLIAHADAFGIWPVLGTILGLALFYRGSRILQQKRLLLTSTSKIRSAAAGLIEVNGLAVGPYTLIAPLSEKQCYYYRTVAWQLLGSAKNEEWKKIADESFHVPFYIDDTTGKLLIDPKDADIDLTHVFHEEYSGARLASKEMPPRVTTFLTRQGISGENKLKLDEYCIEANAPLFISGILAENNGPPISAAAVPTKQAPIASMTIPLPGNSYPGEKMLFRSTPSMAAKSASAESKHGTESATSTQEAETIYLSPESKVSSAREMTQQGKIAAALLRAGIARPSAWAAVDVEKATYAAAVHDHTHDSQSPTFDLQPKLVLRKGEDDSLFLISCRNDDRAVNTMEWSTLIYVWGGPALVLLSVYILLARLGWL